MNGANMKSSQTTTEPDINDLVLPEGWKIVVIEQDRLVYVNEIDKTWSWLPPLEAWRSRHGLSYGWEVAQSSDDKRYYINHLQQETFRTLPVEAESATMVSAPRTRKVVISRHSHIGYGFVAGSEKPVLIRSVAEDGPSADRLYANDQILKINDEDVRDMPQSEVIQRIKDSTQELNLEVIASDDVQDVKNRGQRKSSIMSRTTREKRRSNPVSVRFAESPVLIQYVGSPPSYPLRRSSLPLIPNVLKMYLENGQTRSFLYNSKTVVKDIIASLADKIGLKRLDRFAFTLQATQNLNDYIVQANERVSQVYAKRNCSSSTWLSKLLLIFAPKDIHLFWKEDPVAFDYFYRQMCSQVVEGRFGWELKYDTAIKLAALHLQQYALEEKVGKGGKISVKAIEREVGSLENFVPSALIHTMQKKDLQRILTQQIKQTRNLCPPGQKYISPLQAKLQYLKICSELKTYGGKQFTAVVVDPSIEDQKLFQDQKVNSILFVGPNIGLAQVTNPRSFSMHHIAEFSQINGVVITPHTEGKQNVKLFLNNGKSVTLITGPIFETRDLVYLISGYHKHLVDNARPLSVIDMTSPGDVEEQHDGVPSYSDTHRVLLDDFSYRINGNGDDDAIREMAFKPRPDFEDSELYSLTDHSHDTQPIAAGLSNGSAKTQLSALVNNVNKNLKSIEEETTSAKSPNKSNSGILLSRKDRRSHVNGVRELKRRSLLSLDGDLTSESTDEERNDATNIERPENQDAKDGPDNPVTSPVRNRTSIHISSPSHNKSNHVEPMNNSEHLFNDGNTRSHVHEVKVDIPLTPSIRSSASNTSISSLSSSYSPGTSPVTMSSAILISKRTSKDVVLVNGNSSPAPNGEASIQNSFNDESIEDEHTSAIKTTDTIRTEIPTGEMESNRTETSDVDKLEVSNTAISNDSNLKNGSTPVAVKANGDIRISPVKQKPRRSTGFLSYNGDRQCIILDETPSIADHAIEDKKSHSNFNEQITSRTDACDHALKTFYSLKTRLETLKHSNRSVRSNNEILRSKKQQMIQEIDVLQKCNEQIKYLTASEERNVVKAVLRTKSSLSQLTESCTLVYNAQYSMKHFTSELVELIDKHIDVLITTDAWNTTPVSDLTAEIHKDKCQLVHDSLESLRKIVSKL